MENENAIPPEVELEQVREKLKELVKKGIGDSSNNEEKSQEIAYLEKRLKELDPPPGFDQKS